MKKIKQEQMHFFSRLDALFLFSFSLFLTSPSPTPERASSPITLIRFAQQGVLYKVLSPTLELSSRRCLGQQLLPQSPPLPSAPRRHDKLAQQLVSSFSFLFFDSHQPPRDRGG